MKFTPLILINLLLIGSFGCNTPTKVRSDRLEWRYAVTEISIDQVRAMLSKQLTVQELERHLGKPMLKHSQNWGNILYKLPGEKSLFFGFKGNFVVSARYDKTEITAVHPRIHNVLIQMEQKISAVPGHPVITLPGMYALDGERFQTANDLLQRLSNLPRGSIAEFGFSCTGANPSPEFVDEMRTACERKGITLIIHEAG